MHAYTHIHMQDHARAHKDTTPHMARTASPGAERVDPELLCYVFSTVDFGSQGCLFLEIA